MKPLARLLRALPLAACALLACTTSTISAVHGSINLDTVPIDFGAQPVLTPLTKNLVVTNVGRGVLHFKTPDPLTANTSNAFSLPTGFALTLLEPDQTVTVPITFSSPVLGSYTAELDFESDDPTRPSVTVPLSGQATTVATATATPDCLDFGVVEQGQSSILTVTITSTGTAPLLINSLAFASGSCAAFGPVGSWRTNPPLQLQAHQASMTDDSSEISVVFLPTPTTVPANEMCTGTLNIGTNDPKNVTIPICLKGQMVRAPVAVCGANQMVPPGSPVTVDGSASTDPDAAAGGGITGYAWSITSSPQGSAAAGSLSQATPASPTATFTTDLPGQYRVQLVVTDKAGFSSIPADCTVTAVLSNDLKVELVWDNATTDLDLHMRQEIAPLPALYGPEDCWWNNPSPIWDTTTMTGPEDAGDILKGYGPETIDYVNPPLMTNYRVTVVFANANGAAMPDTNATVNFWLYGVVVGSVTHKMTVPGTFPNDMGEAWDAAVVSWPSGDINTSPPGGTL